MENRVFVTSVITDSMFDKVRSTGVEIRMRGVDEGIDVLKNIDFISALKDEALVRTLNNNGINAEVNPIKVSLYPGDVLYVINPGVRLYDLEQKELPKYSTITVNKYEIIKTY